jgi:hypothetical protein
MEFIAIFLSGLLGLISPAGLVVDRTAENALRDQFTQAEKLQVRVDNAPTHQLLQGKVNRVRIAGRNLRLKGQDIRVAALEVETDPIQLNSLNFSRRGSPFKQPLQAGLRLVLSQQDLNQFLRSPQFNLWIGKFTRKSISNDKTSVHPTYNLSDTQVKFLAKNRLSLQVKLHEQGQEKPLLIQAESGVNILAGRKITLIQPVVFVNGEQAPPRFINQIVNNLNQKLDLAQLDGDGLQVRLLKWDMKPDKIEIAAFLRIEPSAKLWSTPRS